MQTTYDKFPEVTVQGYDDQAWQGWESLSATLRLRASAASRTVLVVDCYPGVRLDELEPAAMNRRSTICWRVT